MSNGADTVIGFAGLSLALVVGYGAYKNKPVFGPTGVVTQALQTGKVGTANPGKPQPGFVAPNPGVQVPYFVSPTGAPVAPSVIPGAGYWEPSPGSPWSTAVSGPSGPVQTSAPAPAPSSSGGILGGIVGALKGLFGG